MSRHGQSTAEVRYFPQEHRKQKSVGLRIIKGLCRFLLNVILFTAIMWTPILIRRQCGFGMLVSLLLLIATSVFLLRIIKSKGVRGGNVS